MPCNCHMVWRFRALLAPRSAASREVSPLQSLTGNYLKGRGCMSGVTRSLASCMACPTCLTTAFMLKFSGTTFRMPRSTLHVATGLVVLSSNTFVLAWPRVFVFWHSRPKFPRVSGYLGISGKHEGSALQDLGWSAYVQNSSLQKSQALHMFCMISAPQSVRNCDVF